MDLISLLDSHSSGLVDFCLAMLVQSSVLIVILFLVDLLLRRKVRAVFRYCLWMLLLVKLVLPVGLALPYTPGYWINSVMPQADASDLAASISKSDLRNGYDDSIGSAAALSDETADSKLRKAPVLEPVSNEPAVMLSAVSSEGGAAAGSPADVQPSMDSAENIVTQRGQVLVAWQPLAILIWLAAVVVMLGLLVQRVFFVRGLIRQSKAADDDLLSQLGRCAAKMDVRRKVDLRVSAYAASPSVCGLLRPVILMPEGLTGRLTGNQVDAVLTHELAHIKRGDLWVNLFQALLQIVYFYNPLLWFANAQIRRVREQAVDEMVLVAMEDRAEDYPETLLNVSKLVWSKPMLSLRLIGVVESKSALTARIKHILNRPFPKSAKLGLAGLAAILFAAVILLPMANSEPVDMGKNIAEASSPLCRELANTIANKIQTIENEIIQRSAVSEVGRTNKYTARVADDITVELLGVAGIPADGKWWDADGNLVEDVYWDGTTNVNKDSKDARQAVLRLISNETDPDQKPSMSVSVQRNSVDEGEGAYVGVFIVHEKGTRQGIEELVGLSFSLHDDHPTVNITATVGYGEWQTLASRKAEVQRNINAILTNAGTVIFNEPVQKDNKTIISLTLLSSIKTARLVAIDYQGKIHTGSLLSLGSDKDDHSPEYQIFKAEFTLPLNDIKEFRFQTRETKTVEFENVSLRPGGERAGEDEHAEIKNYQLVEGLGITAQRPDAKLISFEEYIKLKEEFVRNRGRTGDYALTYREKDQNGWRNFWLMLDGFDNTYAYIGEITQYRSKGWDWIGRYKLARNLQVDTELGITEIIQERSKIIGGIKYGMSVKEVLSIKGNPEEVIPHQRGGSEYWIYNDVKVSVWDHFGVDSGWVRNVEAISSPLPKLSNNNGTFKQRSGLDNPGKETEVEKKGDWRGRFNELYRLQDDQVLKRLASPFIPERKDYYYSEKPSQAEAIPSGPGRFIFEWDGGLKRKSMAFGEVSGFREVLFSVFGINSYEYEMPEELKNLKIPGDWIIRKGASKQAKLDALQTILAEQLGRDIRFEKHTVERKAIVVTGRYHHSPINGVYDNSVHIYSDRLNKKRAFGFGPGSVADLICAIGHLTGILVIDKTEETTKRVHIKHHSSAYLIKIKDEFEKARKLNILLENLSKQTNLKFEIQTQPVETWFVIEDGVEANDFDSKAWGQAVEGAKIGIIGAKRILGRSDWPYPVIQLELQARNNGQRYLHLPKNGLNWQIEVNGQWYEWADPKIYGDSKKFESEVSGGVLLDFNAGDSYSNLKLEIAGNWRKIPDGKEEEYARRQHHGFVINEKDDYGEKLVFKEDTTYQIRAAIACPPSRAGQYTPLRLVSNPVKTTFGFPFSNEKKVTKLNGRVIGADGSGIVNAQVSYATATRTIYVGDGGRLSEGYRGASGEKCIIIQTDAEGKFDLGDWPDESFTLVVTHEKGYAFIRDKDFAADKPIGLKPWGSVKGTLNMTADKLAVQVRLEGLPNSSWMLHRINYLYVTLSDGEFVFENVPAGWFDVGYLTATGISHQGITCKTPVLVKSGEVSEMTIGNDGRPITGRFVPPAGFKAEIYFSEGVRVMTTARAAEPRPDNYDEMSGDEKVEWYKNWRKTEEHQKWIRNYFNKEWRQYVFKINDDGTFKIPNVLPGKYEFYVEIIDRYQQRSGPDNPGGYYGTVEIPKPEPDDSSDKQPYDLGSLTLKMRNFTGKDASGEKETKDVDLPDSGQDDVVSKPDVDVAAFEKSMKMLRTGNEYQRVKAVQNLFFSKHPDVPTVLIDLSKDSNSRVRAYAAQLLSNMSDPRIPDALASVLNDEYRNVRLYAADGLQKIGSLKHVNALVESVCKYIPGTDSTEIDRSIQPMLETIGKLSDKAPGSIIDILRKTKSSDQLEYYHKSIALCLGEIGDSSASGELKRISELLANSKTDYESWYAFRKALNQVSPEKHPFNSPAADILYSFRGGKLTHEGIRKRWIEPLVELGTDAVDDLAWALQFNNEKDINIRRITVQAMGEIGGEEAAKILRQHIYYSVQKKNLNSYGLRIALIALLSADPRENTVDEILEFVKEFPDYDQSYLFNQVNRAGPVLIPDKIKILFFKKAMFFPPMDDISQDIHSPAKFLAQLNIKEAAGALSQVLLKSENSKARNAAAISLGKMSEHKPLDVLVQAWEENKASVGAIAQALGSINDSNALDTLIVIEEKEDKEKIGLDGQLWLAASLAKYGRDYEKNAAFVRNALPASYGQIVFLNDTKTVDALIEELKKDIAKSSFGGQALTVLEKIGTNYVLSELNKLLKDESITPTRLYIYITANQRHEPPSEDML